MSLLPLTRALTYPLSISFPAVPAGLRGPQQAVPTSEALSPAQSWTPSLMCLLVSASVFPYPLGGSQSQG